MAKKTHNFLRCHTCDTWGLPEHWPDMVCNDCGSAIVPATNREVDDLITGCELAMDVKERRN